jgi:hypothetical protein
VAATCLRRCLRPQQQPVTNKCTLPTQTKQSKRN